MNPPSSSIEPQLYSDIKVAVLKAESATNIFGGAERFYNSLVESFREIGCQAELVSIPADESTFDQIIENYKYSSNLDLSSYDVVISTKSPTYAIKHSCHVVYLVHTVRVFDDMFHAAFPEARIEHFIQRSELHNLDFQALSSTKARFAIGHEVANRLYRWRGIKPEVIHPPLCFDGFKNETLGDYFFLPGRLHPWKRVHLIIDAIKRSKMPLKLIITGTGEAEADLKRSAAKDPRIEFLGHVDNEQLIDLYANALAVPFTPIREDYGYVTLEAFASGKAVVTCSDSGEPTYFVKHHENGLISNPNPESLCEALEWIYTNRAEAKTMGQAGQKLISGMSWRKVATQLIDAAVKPSAKTTPDTTNVAVIDMQPITPPVGGGRLRLQGLYHNLGKYLSCKYIGSYDWPGENYRQLRITNGLEEITVPLSNEHFAASQSIDSQAGGKVLIDISFSRLGHLSTNYLKTAEEAIQHADVVVFSHPWVYPLLNRYITPNQVLIYDSQNVEGYLRAQLLDEENPIEADLLRQVVQDEYELGSQADLILTCSQEDSARFNRVYEFPFSKMRVVPNGVMAFTEALPDENSKLEAKQSLRLDETKLTAIFIGSQYGPNIDGARFILEELSAVMPEVIFVIAGGVGEQLTSKRKNVVITGAISEQDKFLWLKAADIAVNPMFSGSGTNIKMFDFMAQKLPTVTTAIGARGIDTGSHNAMLICAPDVESFASAIKQLQDTDLRNSIGEDARYCVEEGYAWERISSMTGAIFKNRHQFAGQPPPLFSIVIPTYERPEQLSELLNCLKNQIERNFEVVIIDQSSRAWENASTEFGFPVTYYHSPVKGAVRARNTGAAIAQGEIIAFTDDDCLPDKYWLINARRYFQDSSNVGVEGRIVSDHLGDPEWRQVTNIDFEGIGFMTANLMVRCSIFQQLGGFDLQFDKPHFREDTDFGWRMLEIGNVPYAKNVEVFHPAQPRKIERESAEERAQFFEKDALLYKKHPGRYQELFERECHYERTPGFTRNLKSGFEKYGVPIPKWIDNYLNK
jgi:glycosyltransferase involved in cell wall biosynthesis